MRQTRLLPLFIISVLSATGMANAAPATPDYNCRTIQLGGKIYNLSSLARVEYLGFCLNYSADFTATPIKKDHHGVSEEILTVTGNPWLTLDFDGSEPCPKDSWVCGETSYKWPGDADPKRTDLWQMGGGPPEPKEAIDKGLSLIFPGTAEWKGVNITFVCKEGASDDPTIVSTANNLTEIKWTTQAGCGERPKSGAGDTRGGWSLFGILSFVMFLMLSIYLVVGSAYNYYFNRIRRFPDMIPNYDVWSIGLAVLWDFVASCWERVSGRRYVAI
ncbi:hypothetical protein HK104_011312 [Borealophlyctis nickersoniae]|nr:hypothetical protein HK104_011312 [Borealophlyctis nickersoniae]